MRRFWASPFSPPQPKAANARRTPRRLRRPRPGGMFCHTRQPCGFSPPTRRSPHESGGEAALGVRRLCAAFGLRLTSPLQPKAANDRRTLRRLRRPRPRRMCCSRPPCGFSASARRSPHESGGEAALGVRRLCAAFGLRLSSPPQPKAANDRRTPRRLRRPRPGGMFCYTPGLRLLPIAGGAAALGVRCSYTASNGRLRQIR